MLVVFIIVKKWKQTKCALTEQINRMRYRHIKSFSLQKEILTHATMWIEDTVLSEISWNKKKILLRFHLYEVFRVVRFIETKSRMVVA